MSYTDTFYADMPYTDVSYTYMSYTHMTYTDMSYADMSYTVICFFLERFHWFSVFVSVALIFNTQFPVRAPVLVGLLGAVGGSTARFVTRGRGGTRAPFVSVLSH